MDAADLERAKRLAEARSPIRHVRAVKSSEKREPEQQKPSPAKCATVNCKRRTLGSSKFCCRYCEEYGGTSHCRGCKAPSRNASNKPSKKQVIRKSSLFKQAKEKAKCARPTGKATSKFARPVLSVASIVDGQMSATNASIVCVAGNTVSPPEVGSFLLVLLAAVELLPAVATDVDDSPSSSASGEGSLYEVIGSLVSESSGTGLDRLQDSLSGTQGEVGESASIFAHAPRTGLPRLV